jgi:hypothetical protein
LLFSFFSPVIIYGCFYDFSSVISLRFITFIMQF